MLLPLSSGVLPAPCRAVGGRAAMAGGRWGLAVAELGALHRAGAGSPLGRCAAQHSTFLSKPWQSAAGPVMRLKNPQSSGSEEMSAPEQGCDLLA